MSSHATQQVRPQPGQQHQERWNRHGKQNILGAFSPLAGSIGPKFHMKVICLIGEFQHEEGKPGQGAGDASPQQLCRQHKDEESDDDMKRVHADSRRMLQEQLELVPPEQCHGLTGAGVCSGVRMRGLIGEFISAVLSNGQPLSRNQKQLSCARSGSLDAIRPETYKARPAQLRKG